MRQPSFTASVLVSLLRSAFCSVVKFLSPSWDGPVRKYRPERHYMRGPGPKWREKHFLDGTSAGSIRVRAAVRHGRGLDRMAASGKPAPQIIVALDGFAD
jgi:hypothetical protein